MFGYVTPLKSELRQQDFVLYRAFYCGICAAIGKTYGSLPRFTTTYDITFLSLLVHDVANQEVTFSQRRCVGNPFSKKVMIDGNGLLDRLCAANVILSYYKLCDDVIDGEGVFKRVARAALRKSYKKAVLVLPEADVIIKKRYSELRELEKSGEKSIDRVSHCFASILKEVAAVLLDGKADDNMLSLCYNIGKFVYLIDALDDVGEDAKKGNYNPFLALYGGFTSRKQFYEDNAEDIGFILNSTVNRAIESFNLMNFTQSYTLLKNIVHQGLREKVNEVLKSEKKLVAPKL